MIIIIIIITIIIIIIIMDDILVPWVIKLFIWSTHNHMTCEIAKDKACKFDIHSVWCWLCFLFSTYFQQSPSPPSGWRRRRRSLKSSSGGQISLQRVEMADTNDDELDWFEAVIASLRSDYGEQDDPGPASDVQDSGSESPSRPESDSVHLLPDPPDPTAARDRMDFLVYNC